MKHILILIAIFCTTPALASVKKGDTILVVKGRPTTSIKPDYYNKDSWYNFYTGYILTDMPGNKYVVRKVKDGYIYFKVDGLDLNGYDRPKYKIDINQAAEDSCIIVFEKK